METVPSGGDPAQDSAPDARRFMQRALELAILGRGWVSPNPMSGAVVVRDGQIVGEGFHPATNKSHAEIFALDAAGDQTRGATLYLAIEPCRHAARAGCVDRILDVGIKRVVIAHEDPNPATSGKGIAMLREAGIQVDVGMLGDACRRLNEANFKFMATRRPFVALYGVMSLDGKIATSIGERPIAPQSARDELLAAHDAVLLGVSAVMQDDPDVGSGLPRSRNPLRVVVDGMARTPATSRILAKPGPAEARPGTLIVTTKFAPDDRIVDLKAAGAEILIAPEEGEPLAANIDLGRLMVLLGKRDITSLLIEAGGTLSDAVLSAGVVDKIYVYVFPGILGGTSAPSLVGGLGASFIEEAQMVTQFSARPCGDGLLIEAYLGPV